MMQTAVEWLVAELRKPYEDEWIGEIIKQAKEMEKQQMEDCWRFGRGSYIDKEPETFEQYYNKEYGGETMNTTNNNKPETTI